MASGFNVHAAAGYEQLMGRWSRKLAPYSSTSRGLPMAKGFSTSAAAPVA